MRSYTSTGLAITNTAGGIFVDGLGVVSTETFSTNETTDDAANQSITGTETEALSNGTLSLVLDRTALVYHVFNAQAFMVNGTLNTGCYVFPVWNGSPPDETKMFITLLNGNNYLQTFSSYHLGTLGAGTHTLVLSAALTEENGTPASTCTITRHKSSYIVLGK